MEHSAKPQIIRDSLVKLIGDVPRIELFARTADQGWDSWGNEMDTSVRLTAGGFEQVTQERCCMNITITADPGDILTLALLIALTYAFKHSKPPEE